MDSNATTSLTVAESSNKRIQNVDLWDSVLQHDVRPHVICKEKLL